MDILKEHQERTRKKIRAMDDLIRLHKELCTANTDLGHAWAQDSGATREKINTLEELSHQLAQTIQSIREAHWGELSQDSLLTLYSKAESMDHRLL